jgi:hypothetical protein
MIKKILPTLLFFGLFATNVNAQNQAAEDFLIKDLPAIGGDNVVSNAINNAIEVRKLYQSLMYSQEEADGIKKAIEANKSGQAFLAQEESSKELTPEEKAALEEERKRKELAEINERSKIHLGSILYFSENSWVIWLNKNKISASDNKASNEFYVESIDGNEVVVLWSLSLTKWRVLSGRSNNDDAPKTNASNRVTLRFTLMPNQTYLLRDDVVIEGKTISLASQSS